MLRSSDRIWLVVVVCVALAAGLVGYTAATISASAQAPAVFSNDPKDYDKPEGSIIYKDNVRKAVELRAKGDLQGALDAFSTAAVDGDILEQPIYEIWADMADLYCRLGKKTEGRVLINEFRCASAIVTDQKVCTVNSNRDPALFQIPDADITPLCYQAVCNDPFGTVMSGAAANALTQRHNRIIAAVEARCTK